MKGEREVGGLWCSEVLELLVEYVDGGLDESQRHQVEDHLAACDVCERFGDEYATLVRRIRGKAAPPVSGEIEHRLRDRLARELATGE